MRFVLFSVGSSKFCINEENVSYFFNEEKIKASHDGLKRNFVLKKVSLNNNIYDFLDTKKLLGVETEQILNKIMLIKFEDKEFILPIFKIDGFIEGDVQEINSYFKKVIVKDKKIYPLLEDYLFNF